jgi:DNA-binding GntR family transcriptional regulator
MGVEDLANAGHASGASGAADADLLWTPRLYDTPDPKPAQRGSDLIYRAIRQAIVSGRIPPWVRLVEEDLADQFGVSRSPVREALRHLEYDGLAQRLRRGMLVAVPFGEGEREDIHLIRMEMDRLAARLAVQRAKPEDWDPAREAVASLGTALRDASSPSAASLAHLEVHAAINWVAFGQRLGAMMTRTVGTYSGLADIDYVQQPGYSPFEQHLELIDELASGDEARALAAMDKHAIRGGETADPSEA